MNKSITKQQILELIKDQNFKTEDQLKKHIVPHLAKLFKVKESQIEQEATTTSFDYKNSERADLLIKTDGSGAPKVLIVIELKISKSVEDYNNGNYKEPRNQLSKYSQDTRAPYGILLTDRSCFIYRNKYFFYNQEPKRIQENKIPSINKIEEKITLYTLLDFLLCKKSFKYIYIFIIFSFVITTVFSLITDALGILISMVLALLIGIIGGLIFFIKTRKTIH